MEQEPQPSLALSTTPGNEKLSMLLEEFRRSGAQGDYLSRDKNSDDTRLARWDSQSDDGKKYDRNNPDGQPAFPWDGASDVRCYQSDEVCNEGVAINTAAFWRSDIRLEGVEAGDLATASACTTFMNWVRNTNMRTELESEVELSSQFVEWKGWTALHVSWEREVAFRRKMIRMEEAVQTAQAIMASEQIPPDMAELAGAMVNFPTLVANKDTATDAAKALQVIYRTYVNQSLPKNLMETDIPELAMDKAKRMVKELRENGETSVPFPYLCKNRPSIVALKPWRDIILPPDTTDLQSSRVVFVRRLMSEPELRAMVLSEGWDKDFVENAVKTAGRLSVWSFSNQNIVNPLFNWSYTNQKNRLIEIIIAYHKAVDEDGVSGVYYTIFSPHVTVDGNDSVIGNEPMVAKEGIYDGPNASEYPIVITRREQLDRQVMASRGVPEILLTSQREEKVLRDSVMDYLSIATIPPLLVYKGTMGQRYKMAPAAEQLVTPGREPRFMELPSQGPQIAVEWMQQLRAGVDNYFGRFKADVPPQLSQLIMEPKVRRFLSAWSQALKLAFDMYVFYAPDTFERVTGLPAPQSEDTNLDFIFHFDVAQLNPELMEKKLAGFSAMLPEDSAGVLNRAALIRAKARMIDPQLARELIMEEGPASMQMLEGVRVDLVKMSDGNEAVYTDATNDPSAGMKMDFLRKTIAANPKYQARLDPGLMQMLQIPPSQYAGAQVDPLFTAYVKKYVENLQQGMNQQENKQIGRTGVRPLTNGAQ